jgi:manganese/zinc/iron transport system permease protein
MHAKDGFDFSQLLPQDSWLIGAGIISALITTFLSEQLQTRLGVHVDASIGMVFTFLFAVGIILVTAFTKSAHVGAELLMGNVDALQYQDLTFIGWISLVNCLFVLLFWRALFVSSFDPLFAKMCNLSNRRISYLVMLLVSITAIGAFRAVGVLLYLAFLVTPPLISRLYTYSLKTLVLFSALVAVLCSLVAVALARHLVSVFALPCSTASLVVTLLSLSYALAVFVQKLNRSARYLSQPNA